LHREIIRYCKIQSPFNKTKIICAENKIRKLPQQKIEWPGFSKFGGYR
jgi:hypothetical protein